MLVPSTVPARPGDRSSREAVSPLPLRLCALPPARAARADERSCSRAARPTSSSPSGSSGSRRRWRPAMLLSFMELGWWFGHVFELLGIMIVGIPVALDLRRTAQSRPLVGDVSGADLVAGRGGVPRLRTSARSLFASPARTSTRRSTRAASPCARSRSARSSASPAVACERSPPARSCTTSASFLCPTRSSRSRGR